MLPDLSCDGSEKSLRVNPFEMFQNGWRWRDAETALPVWYRELAGLFYCTHHHSIRSSWKPGANRTALCHH